MANIVALYIRLSVEDAKVESMSIENQKLALHKFADSLDELADMEVQEFVDNGYSGTNFERPAVQELLDKVREGKVKCIVVKDFSRFGRDSLEVGYFMEKVFPLYGVRFISLNDDFDSGKLHGDTGGINVAFKYLISEFYSRDLSQKYKSAKYVKFRRGEYQSKICPYGYQKGGNGRLEPDPETAPVVRLIFELEAQGHNTTEIIKALFDQKIATPGEYKKQKGQANYDVSRCSGIWCRSSVLNILRDERYTGTYIIGKRESREVGSALVRLKDESQWVKIPHHHAAIISKEQFEQAQRKIRKEKCVKKNAHPCLFGGKVYCGCCQHRMQRIGNKTFRFYCKHTVPDTNAACYGLKISESELEALIYDVLSRQAQIILNTPLPNAGQSELQFAQQNEYSRQLEAIKAQKRELFEELVLKGITDSLFKEQKTSLEQETSRLQQLHDAATAQAARAQMDEQTKNARAQLAKKIVDSGKLSAELVDALIGRVYVYPGNQIEVVWKMGDFSLGAYEV